VIYWLAKHLSLGPLLRFLFRPWVEGLDNVPAEGPAIIASNHLSFSDSFFFPVAIPRRVTFLAKSDYFTGRGLRGWLTAGFFRGLGQLPVDRASGRGGQAALRTGLRVLERGELLGIYPEGTRSPDGRLYRGRVGVARLALAAKVPVIPVAMIDTDKVQPPGQLVPKLMRPGMRIGAPLDFSRYAGLEKDRYVLRAVTDEIMYAIMRLSGQEYVDVYATSVKARLAEQASAGPQAHEPGDGAPADGHAPPRPPERSDLPTVGREQPTRPAPTRGP
jgi:1-acyl-sn-glycerol-3-phosphate acyltransferase